MLMRYILATWLGSTKNLYLVWLSNIYFRSQMCFLGMWTMKIKYKISPGGTWQFLLNGSYKSIGNRLLDIVYMENFINIMRWIDLDVIHLTECERVILHRSYPIITYGVVTLVWVFPFTFCYWYGFFHVSLGGSALLVKPILFFDCATISYTISYPHFIFP